MDEKEFWEAHDKTKARVETIAMEALSDIFHRIPFGEEVLFSDGRKGTIKPFIEPTISMDRDDHLKGIPRASIDIEFEDGHLEFVLYQSGWGGDVAPKDTQ